MRLFIVLIVVGYLMADGLTAYINKAPDLMRSLTHSYSLDNTTRKLVDMGLIDVCELDPTLMGCGDPDYR